MIDINEGGSIHLNCKITAVPMPELEWRKDGVLVETGDNVFVYPGGRTIRIMGAR